MIMISIRRFGATLSDSEATTQARCIETRFELILNTDRLSISIKTACASHIRVGIFNFRRPLYTATILLLLRFIQFSPLFLSRKPNKCAHNTHTGNSNARTLTRLMPFFSTRYNIFRYTITSLVICCCCVLLPAAVRSCFHSIACPYVAAAWIVTHKTFDSFRSLSAFGNKVP